MEPNVKMINAALLEKLASDDPVLQKQGQDIVTEYIRMRMREDGFWRRVLPPVTVDDSDLDRQVDTDKPVVIIDKEPNSPAAYMIPFGTLPKDRPFFGPRFRVMFSRILTERFRKDIAELHTYTMDIRQIINDNSTKDMLREEDTKAIAAVNTILVGQDTVIDSDVAQWVAISGGITRENFAQAMKILPSTNAHLNPAVGVINNISIWDIVKWGRDEVGGDFSEELLRTGFAERDFMGINLIITIKTDLVPTNSLYQFAEPKYLGKFFVLEDATMVVKREAYILEFWSYECIGSAIANVKAVGRADFTA